MLHTQKRKDVEILFSHTYCVIQVVGKGFWNTMHIYDINSLS